MDRHHLQGSGDAAQKSPEFPRNPQRNAGKNRESPTQYKLSESNSSESKLIEEEDEGQPPPNVVTFPAARDAEDNADSYPSEEILQATKQVAAILKLSASDALARVVADYLHNPGMSLFGEADAAREWIEDRQRNRKQQRLTPSLFQALAQARAGVLPAQSYTLALATRAERIPTCIC